jgi:hypothetical protein
MLSVNEVLPPLEKHPKSGKELCLVLAGKILNRNDYSIASAPLTSAVKAYLAARSDNWEFTCCRDYPAAYNGKLINRDRSAEFGLVAECLNN